MSALASVTLPQLLGCSAQAFLTARLTLTGLLGRIHVLRGTSAPVEGAYMDLVVESSTG
jgi:hypothetical protein